jgi:hypothetical protein
MKDAIMTIVGFGLVGSAIILALLLGVSTGL